MEVCRPLWDHLGLFCASAGSNYPLRAGKATVYQGGVRSFGMIGGGALPPFARGIRFDGLVHAVDIPATLLDAAGLLPTGALADGVSIWRSLLQLQGGRKTTTARGGVIARTEIPINLEGEVGKPENSAFLIRVSGGVDLKLVLSPALHYDGYYNARDSGKWTHAPLKSLCLKVPKQPCVSLFNLTADPNETTNLALRELIHSSLVVDLVERFVKTYMFEPSYRRVQNMSRHDEAWPDKHDGVWAPWINASTPSASSSIAMEDAFQLLVQAKPSLPMARDWLRGAASSALVDAAAGQPGQVHLSLGESDGELSVTWITRNECPASFVAWGEGSTTLRHIAIAASTTYSVPPHWWQPTKMPWIHTAVVRGLKSRQRFFYSAGDNFTAGCSLLPPIAAVAPPFRGELPLRSALMADVGSIEVLGFEVWRALDERTPHNLQVDLAVHAGDVSYAGMYTSIPFLNVSKLDEWEPLWDVYGTAHHNFTRRRAYMIGVGNHEAWYNWTALTHRYPMRQMNAGAAVKAQARPPFWYTFESGGVHWTMFSSEHDYAEGSPQHAFAKDALSSVNRTVTPWSAVRLPSANVLLRHEGVQVEQPRRQAAAQP